MSHVVELKTTEVKICDKNTLVAACRRLKLKDPVWSNVRMYNASREGWSIELPGWKYPVIANLEKGVIEGDNYNGRWGRVEELTKLETAYTAELALQRARESHRFSMIQETVQEDGTIMIECTEY